MLIDEYTMGEMRQRIIEHALFDGDGKISEEKQEKKEEPSSNQTQKDIELF